MNWHAPGALDRIAPAIVFKALGDPTRRAIFEHLARDGEQNVRALTHRAGVSQPAVSKHLALLKLAGLIHDRPHGRETHYRAEPDGLKPLIDWMGVHGALWNTSFNRLDDLLKRMDN